MSSALIARYWKAQDPYDPETLAACRHPQWTAEWPQSGERVPGHHADVAIHQNYPGYPRHSLDRLRGESEEWTITPFFAPVRVQGSGGLWVGEARLQYPQQGLYHVAAILELEDDLVFRETLYFAESFSAPEWRSDLVEPKTPEDPGRWEEAIQTVPSTGDEETRKARVRRVFEAATAGGSDADRRGRYAAAVREAFHPDGEEIIVSSGELIRGVDRMIAVTDRHPDFPKEGQLRRIIGTGDIVVLEGRLLYEQAAFWEATIYTFRGERIATASEYYAEEIEPPQWRNQWVERI